MSSPSYKDLKEQFDYVSSFFEKAEWTHDSDEPDASLDKMELFHPGKYLSTKEVKELMEKEGLRPASFGELVEWAKANPDGQKKYPIIALGSSCLWDDDRDFPFLYWDGCGRDLNLDWSRGDWREHCRFLAVSRVLGTRNLGASNLDPSAIGLLERVQALEKEMKELKEKMRNV